MYTFLYFLIVFYFIYMTSLYYYRSKSTKKRKFIFLNLAAIKFRDFNQFAKIAE